MVLILVTWVCGYTLHLSASNFENEMDDRRGGGALAIEKLDNLASGVVSFFGLFDLDSRLTILKHLTQ